MGKDGLIRVEFRFGKDMEVRYLADVPAEGTLVTRLDEEWRAGKASTDRSGGYRLSLRPVNPSLRAVRHHR